MADGVLAKNVNTCRRASVFFDYDMVMIVDTADGKGILGEIDTETDNMEHGLPHLLDGGFEHLHSGIKPAPEWGSPCHSLGRMYTCLTLITQHVTMPHDRIV